MKHVLAAGVAALLIAVAILVRSEFLDDDGSGTSGGSDGGGSLVVACIAELLDACRSIEGAEVVEADHAGVAAAPGVDVWVTFDPLPDFVEIASGDDTFGETVFVAQTPLVIASRTAAVPPQCDPASVPCIAAAEARRVVLPRHESASGLLIAAVVASQYFAEERDLPDFASNDFDAEFRAWVSALGNPSGDPLLDMLQLGPAGPIATGGLDVVAAPTVAASRDAGNIVVGSGVPAAVARVVVAPVGDAPTTSVAEELRAVLLDAGWDPATDDGTNLPGAGVLVALSSLLQEVQ